MSSLHKVVVSSIAALAFTGAALAQWPVRPAGVGPLQRAPTSDARPVAVTHGTWMQGPGTYTLTVCDSGCVINGAPGTTINLAIETWGAGGGGGGGQYNRGAAKHGTSGGGGGGGGAYTPTTKAVIVPASGSTTAYQVTVGAGGTPGTAGPAVPTGGTGGASEIRLNGQIVAGATGGAGGKPGVELWGGGQGGAGGIASAGGQGVTAAGHPGGVGATVNTCNGGGGGAGGIGSGPGAINNGGAGGHGGYYHNVLQLCTAQSSMNGLSAGAAGGNGRVKITW